MDLFEIEGAKQVFREKIKVIGVGGGGCNALNHIIASNVQGVEFIAANTDVAHLDQNLAEKKLVLGRELTRGHGAGANPEIGMKAAKESIDDIKECLKEADMIFLAVGMGGGTGTGATPIIAEVAKEMGALVVAVATKPFSFEGRTRMSQALMGIENLKSKVDALIVIPNEKLFEIADIKMSVPDAFKLVDEVLRQAVQGVTDLILRPGLVNVDFADVKAVMSNAGAAIMGIGEGRGETRATTAAMAAINSPLMEVPMRGAKGLLFNITGGPTVSIHEIKEAAQVITEAVDEDATIIWGHVLSSDSDDKLQITVIATGFSAAEITSSKGAKRRSRLALEETDVKATPEEDLFRLSGAPLNHLDIPSVIRRKRSKDRAGGSA
jgi:cell division protein FtsZ